MGNKKGRDDPSLKQTLLNSPELDAEADSTAVANKNISKPKGNHPNTKATSKSKGKRNKKIALAPSEPPEKESLLDDGVNANSGWEEFPMDEKSDSLSALPSPSEEISKFQGEGSFVADTPSLESDPEDIVAEAPPSERQDLHLSEDTSLHLSSSGILTPVPKSPKLNEGQETEKDDAVHEKRVPLPIQISKAALAEPKIDHGSVPGITSSKKDFSVQEIPKGEPMGLPSEYDITIIHAAQSGNTIALEYILDKDPSKVNEKDPGDCSPLHWAAINNRIEAARFLLKNGADVDAQGGDLKATPLHWACRQGLLDMMVLLLEFGADPTLMDSQGFNIVHLSIHSFNFMSLIYSLSLPGLEVDVADGQGHTPLMWAAYQGFSQAVELLLKFKADVHARDNTDYTSLHWGVVKGDEGIIQKLIVAHADLLAVDNQGQTPSDLAIVSKTEAAWQSALIATGHDPADLSTPSKRWTAARVKRVALVLPVPLMSMIMLTIVYAPWEMALPMVTLQLWLFYHFGIKKLLKKCSPALCLQESPYHVGIFLTTVLFTFKTYLSTIAPNTFSDYRWTNMLFSSLFAASLYFYWLVTTSDPGFLPRYNTLSDRKELLQSLAQDGRLTLRHFCTSCLAQRPIRSKHCRFCNRCVARFDHHCPWNFNCVGAVNHREFVLFTLNLALGIILFEYLGSTFLSTLPINYSASQLPCILNEKACTYFQQQPFLMFTLIWNGLQLFWLAMVVGYQLYLVARSTTTNESINHDKYSYFVSSPALDQSAHRRPSALNRLASYIHPRAGHVTPRSQFRNPFDRGVVTNCLSFWLHRPSPTYWYHLYDTPPEIVCDENPYTSVPLNELGPTNDLDRPEEIELIDDQFMDSSLFPSTKADILSNARH